MNSAPGDTIPVEANLWPGFCGNTLATPDFAATPADPSHCNTPCNGDPTQLCGGASYHDLYQIQDPLIGSYICPATSGFPATYPTTPASPSTATDSTPSAPTTASAITTTIAGIGTGLKLSPR